MSLLDEAQSRQWAAVLEETQAKIAAARAELVAMRAEAEHLHALLSVGLPGIGPLVWLVIGGKVEGRGRATGSDGEWVHWLDDTGRQHVSRRDSIRLVLRRGA